MVTCPPIFERAAQSKTLTGVPLVCLLVLSILLLILSAIQAGDISDDEAAMQDWDCSDAGGSEYIFPFHFKLNDDALSLDGEYGCRWRERNTIFRLLIVCLCIIASIASLVIVCFKPNPKIWTALWWIHWLLFVMMFIVFILDCDGLNTGYQSCVNDFDVLLFFFLEIESCYVTPYIWTVLVDLTVSIVCYCTYRISRYYIVDDVARRMSVEQNKRKKSNPNKFTATTTTAAATTTNTSAATTTTFATNTATNNKKDDSPDPFAEYAGSYDVDTNKNNNTNTNDNAYGDGAYGDNAYGNAFDE